MKIEKSQEMRLFSPAGERLYLTAQERKCFLTALNEEERENRMFCKVLYYTGCRPSEALELTPSRILIDSKDIVFRTLKKRKIDGRGRVKQPEFRSVPVPSNLIEDFDLVFDIRTLHRRQEKLNKPFWVMSRVWKSSQLSLQTLEFTICS